MNGMGVSPHVVWSEGKDPDNTSKPVAYVSVFEERPVPAVVLNGEKAQKKSRIEEGKREGQPVAVGQRPPGQSPERDERAYGNAQFDPTT